MAIKLDGSSLESFPFQDALQKWHASSQRRTTTASSTDREKAEQHKAESDATKQSTTGFAPSVGAVQEAAQLSATATASRNVPCGPSPASSSIPFCGLLASAPSPAPVEPQLMQSLAPFLHQMPGDLAIQLNQWAQNQRGP